MQSLASSQRASSSRHNWLVESVPTCTNRSNPYLYQSVSTVSVEVQVRLVVASSSSSSSSGRKKLCTRFVRYLIDDGNWNSNDAILTTLQKPTMTDGQEKTTQFNDKRRKRTPTSQHESMCLEQNTWRTNNKNGSTHYFYSFHILIIQQHCDTISDSYKPKSINQK